MNAHGPDQPPRPDPATTTRSVRRDRSQRSALVALVADHAVAKMVALLFAGVTVALIDRELVVPLWDNELSIRVVAASDAGEATPAGRSELLLVTEDGVAVHRLHASKVHVVIRGRKKVRDLDRGFVGRAVVRRAWLAGGLTSRQLDGSEFDVAAPVDSIRFTGTVQVDFDEEVAASLKLAADFRDVPPGLAASATFRPPELKVLGARAWLSGADAPDRATIAIDCAGRSDAFVTEVTETPEDLRRKFIRPAPGAAAMATVRFAAAKDEPFVVDRVPFRLEMSPSTAGEFEFVPLAPAEALDPTVTVHLRGPRDRTEKYGAPAALEELRKTLRATADGDALAREAAPYLDAASGAAPELPAKVEVLRIPEGLKFDHASQVNVRVARRKKRSRAAAR
jgi:hypothetical protein